MRQQDEGLKSDALRAALTAAVAGNSQKLEDHLCRYGGGADSRPNLRLAAAFGVEIASLPGSPVRLLTKFSADDSAPDDPRVFLPLAASHGWVALLRANAHVGAAWAALAELAADERAPVRVGTLDALSAFALREGGGLQLVQAAQDWLHVDDHQKRFSAAALVIEALAERRVVTALAARPELLDYLAGAIAEIADAPRSAERLDGRRRLLMSLPPTLAVVVAVLAPGDRGTVWFEEICKAADDPTVRKVLSDAILRLRKTPLGHGSAIAQRLRETLEGSAKPLRDPTRLRPGTGRGKASRPMR